MNNLLDILPSAITKSLPMEIVNKILIMRPVHPCAVIIKKWVSSFEKYNFVGWCFADKFPQWLLGTISQKDLFVCDGCCCEKREWDCGAAVGKTGKSSYHAFCVDCLDSWDTLGMGNYFPRWVNDELVERFSFIQGPDFGTDNDHSDY